MSGCTRHVFMKHAYPSCLQTAVHETVTEILFFFQLPLNSRAGSYELLVKGHAEGRLLFSNSTSLLFEHKSISVFIQTDKSLYKPGQEVNLRVVTVDPDLKPFKTSLSIYIRVSTHWKSSNKLESA